MIPILDLKEGFDLEDCKALTTHLSTVGFVYLKNHGISNAYVYKLIEKMLVKTTGELYQFTSRLM